MTRLPSRSFPLAGLVLVGLFTACCAPAPEATTPDVAGQQPEGQPQLAIRNLSTPFDNVMCSGQPTEAEFDSLKAAGVTRVIHLRLPSEKGTGWEEERAAKSGLQFVRLEIAGKAGLTKENVQRFHELMQQQSEGTTLVSCGSSNRVGALFALKAFWIDKLPREDALAIGRRSGMKSLAATVEKLTAN